METAEQVARFNEILAEWRDNFVDKHKDMRCPNRDQHEEFYEIDDVHYTGWGAFSYHFRACCPVYEMEIQPLLLQEKMYNPPNLSPAALVKEAPTIRSLIERWFKEVWNLHKADVIPEFVPEGCKIHGLSETEMSGSTQFAEFHAMVHAALPDVHVRSTYHLVENDLCASLIHVSGTHKGELMGVPPTGKKIDFTAMVFTHWKDGKVIEAWNLSDMETVLKAAAKE